MVKMKKLLSKGRGAIDKEVSKGKEAVNIMANKVIEKTSTKDHIGEGNSELTNQTDSEPIEKEVSKGKEAVNGITNEAIEKTSTEDHTVEGNSELTNQTDSEPSVQEESEPIEKEVYKGKEVVNGIANKAIEKNNTEDHIGEGNSELTNQTDSETSVQEESKEIQERVSIVELNDNSSNDEKEDNDEVKQNKTGNQDYTENSTSLNEEAQSIPGESESIKIEVSNEGEDSIQDISKNSEKELKILIKTGHEAMGGGLKQKEHKAGGAEKILIKIGNKAALARVKKAAKAKAGGGAKTAETTERADPTGFCTFIEGYGVTDSMQDFVFKEVSKLIIKKTVGEVPERYKFMVKVATTFAVKQTLAALFGVPPVGGMDLMAMKLSALIKKVEEISKKVDTIIEEPMQTAGDHFLRALNHIEDGDNEDSVPEIREALNNSLKAINYIKGNKKYIKGILTCTKYLTLGDQLMVKYDKEDKVFLPHDILPIHKKNKIKKITKKHLDALVSTNNQHKEKPSLFKSRSGKRKMEVAHHDVVDGFIRQQFSYLVPPGSMIPPKYLPAGHADAVIYNIHKKVIWSPKHLSSLLFMWKNEAETHFRVIDGYQLLEFPISEEEEFDISMPTSETLLFSATDGSEMIPTILKLEEEYPNLVEDWKANERDDCLKLYYASSQINRQDPVQQKNWILWEEAKNGDIDKITYAINIGAEIDSRNSLATGRENKSALHYTSEAGYVECTQRLLELGANPDIEDEFCCTPLHLAARGGHLEVVEVLCEAGANILVEIKANHTARDMTEDVKIKEYLTQLMDETDGE